MMAGRAFKRDGMGILKMFPRRPACRTKTHLYAIAFAGGVLKIGQTQSPRTRLAEHWLAMGGVVEWIHLFGAVDPPIARKVEQRAPSSLRSMASQIAGSREWSRTTARKAHVLKAIRSLVSEVKA